MYNYSTSCCIIVSTTGSRLNVKLVCCSVSQNCQKLLNKQISYIEEIDVCNERGYSTNIDKSNDN